MATQYLSVSVADKLRVAASKGYVEQVREFLDQGATCEPDKEGRTPLHYAALNGYSQVVNMLLGDNCDIDAQDVLGFTALHRAASQGHCDVIKTLLDQGCSVDKQGQVHGNTAVHEAAWNGYSQCIQTLIKYGKANVFVANKAGFTALHLACQNGHNQSARELLYGGCNPDFKNNYGDTPLHTGARYGHAGVVRILVSTQCRVNEQNKNGDTALHIAAALRRKKICKLLCEAGIDVNIRNKQSETAIDVSRRKEHPEIILLITSQPKTKHRQHHHGHHRKPRREFDELGRKTPDFDRISPVPERKSSMDRQTPDPGGTGDGGEKKEKKVLFFFKKKEKKDKGPPPKTEAQIRYEEDQRRRQTRLEERRRQKGKQGFFSHYVPKQGTQYYRDLAGNIRQGPVGYTPLCQCGPALRSLEHKVDTDNEHLYAHIDATRDILGQKIDQLGARTSHQILGLDQTMQDRLHQEELKCRQRIDETYNDRTHQPNNVQHQLNSWMDARMMHFQRKLREEYRGYTGQTREDLGYQPQIVRGRRDEKVGFPLVRSKSDETLTCSEHSGKKNFTFSRKVAIEHMKRLKEREKHIQQREMMSDTRRQNHGMPTDHLDAGHHRNNGKMVDNQDLYRSQGNNMYSGHHVPNTTHNESSMYEPVYGRLPASQSTPHNLSHYAQRNRNVHDFDPQRAKNLIVYEKPKTLSQEKSEKSSSNNQRSDLYAKPWYVSTDKSNYEKQVDNTRVDADVHRPSKTSDPRLLDRSNPMVSHSNNATSGRNLHNAPQMMNVDFRNENSQRKANSNIVPSQSMHRTTNANDYQFDRTQNAQYSQTPQQRPSSRMGAVPKQTPPHDSVQYAPQMRSYKRSNSPDFKRPAAYNERAVDVGGQSTTQQRQRSLSPNRSAWSRMPESNQNNLPKERSESPQSPDYAQKLRELSRLSNTASSMPKSPDVHYNEHLSSKPVTSQGAIRKDTYQSQPPDKTTNIYQSVNQLDNVRKSIPPRSLENNTYQSLTSQQYQSNKQKQQPFHMQNHIEQPYNAFPGKSAHQPDSMSSAIQQNHESRRPVGPHREIPTRTSNTSRLHQNYQNYNELSSQSKRLPVSKSEPYIGMSSHKTSFANQGLAKSNETMNHVQNKSSVPKTNSTYEVSQSLNLIDKDAGYDFHLINDPMKDISPGDHNMHDSGCGSASPTYTGLPKEGSAGSNPDSGYDSRIYGLHGGDSSRSNGIAQMPNGIVHGSQPYGAPWPKFHQSTPHGVTRHSYDHLIPSNQLPPYPKHAISPLARSLPHMVNNTSGTKSSPTKQGPLDQPLESDHTVKQAVTSELQRWYERMHQTPGGAPDTDKTPNHVTSPAVNRDEQNKKHLLPPLSSDV